MSTFDVVVNGVSLSIDENGVVFIDDATKVIYEDVTIVDDGEIVTKTAPVEPVTQKIWVKVREGVVETYASQADADAAKTEPRAEKRFVIDVTAVPSAKNWQTFTVA